jgi:diguanylate cyclase (GGDEF)-like protein
MSEKNHILEIITNETRDTITKMDVVTPSIYASIFSKYAQEHNFNIQNEDELSRNLLKEECSYLTDLQHRTSKSANILTQNTTKAITAMRDKNDSLLQNVLQETEKLRIELEKLKESVYQDELTHAYNRKWLHDNYIKDGKTFIKNGTLALLDLNYFKIINDTHGHIIGDKVLIFIANQLKIISKNVVRYGGDEFLVIFSENTTQNEAIEKLNKMRENILSKKLKAHKEMFTLSFSFGITAFKESDELAHIIEDADKNMYLDKIEFKKRVTGI